MLVVGKRSIAELLRKARGSLSFSYSVNQMLEITVKKVRSISLRAVCIISISLMAPVMKRGIRFWVQIRINATSQRD